MFVKKTQSRTIRRGSCRGNYERLEQRAMLAGNVLVNIVDGGNVYIRGDAADNHIEIVGTARSSEQFEIIGVNGTTLNGQSDPIVVNAARNGAGFGDIASVETDLGLRSNLGQGNDTMLVSRVEFSGKSYLYGGLGDDSIGLHQVEFPNDVTIQTFTGDDAIAINNSIMRGETRILSLDGNDTVGFDGVSFYGDTLVVTGSNHDKVATDRSFFSGDTLILTQAGDDFVTVGDDIEFDTSEGGRSQPKRVFLGEGDDTLVATESLFNKVPYVFSGQDGFDRIEVSIRDLPDNNIIVRSFEQTSVENSTARVNQVYEDLIERRALLAFTATTVAAIPELSTFSEVLDATGLSSNRLMDRDAAVFAPTNAAFEAFGSETLESLSDPELLNLIDFHRGVIENGADLFSSDLANLAELDTVFGEQISIELHADGLLLNGNSRVVITDFRTENGVIHIVDAVLMPVE